MLVSRLPSRESVFRLDRKRDGFAENVKGRWFRILNRK